MSFASQLNHDLPVGARVLIRWGGNQWTRGRIVQPAANGRVLVELSRGKRVSVEIDRVRRVKS